MKALPPTISKGVFTAQLLSRFYLWDTAPQHAYKNKERPPFSGRGTLSGTLLVWTRRSTTQPALLLLPSASPTNGPLTGP